MPYKDKQKEKERNKRYREANKEKIAELKKFYYEANKEKAKAYYEANKEKKLEHSKLYYKANKEKILEQKNLYHLKRLGTDPKFKLDHNISSAIRVDLKHRKASKNGRRWEKLVGYTIQQLSEHLEKQFDENMTWENQGSYWHIDHIKPKSLFTYNDAECEEFRKCWGLENLRPLEGRENIRKSNKYSEEDNE